MCTAGLAIRICKIEYEDWFGVALKLWLAEDLGR